MADASVTPATGTQANDTPLGTRILKVNHAGEHGAISIYAGQLVMARWTAPQLLAELRLFQSHEVRHRDIFAAELRRRGQRRCRSFWLCGAGGYLLGLITGLFGRSAIAATTVAVEAVVLRHLQHQLEKLHLADPLAVAAISAIVDEEQQHHDEASLHESAGPIWSRLLKPLVAASTETVIWLGMRL